MSYQVRSFDLGAVQGLSKKALDLHLGLYRTYVEQLNKLLEQLPQGRGSPPAQGLMLDGYARRFAFEYNGVVLHELFFEVLAGKPAPPSANSALLQALNASFGGFDEWKSAVESLGKTRGVGWVLTVRERNSTRLHNCWVDLHQLNLPVNTDVLFALDLWEHAFMLDFTPAQRADYIKTIFDNTDWNVVNSRLEQTRAAAKAA
jgi:Fe-Mn family superoxide dismutase